MDLTMNDPKTGRAWDLADKDVQSRVKKLIRSTQPYCIIGSPPCTPFSRLQEISRRKRDPKVVAEELRKGKEHIRFCVQVYRMQLAAKRHFVHEHPATATSWQMDEMKELMMEPMVDAEVIHMCAYGMKSADELGEGLVKKPTKIMSSAPEVLKRVRARCTNEEGMEQHRHVALVQGRAKAAQVYPRELCVRICEGIAAQRKLDGLGMEARPLMSLSEMRSATRMIDSVGCPSEALHEQDGEFLEAWDDVSGQALDPQLMMKARRDEIAYFKEMGVYEKVDIAEAWRETGKAPIAVRWVDINKGDSVNPNYRSRLVAKEFNTGVKPELYAATPPSECLRLMLSLLAGGRSRGMKLMYADVSRAYFYAKAVRPVYVKLPDEDLEEGDEHRCGRLKMSMYGTRDAALNWSLEYAATLQAAGYVQGKANPCLFHNGSLGVSVMVHGDDFVAVGPQQHLEETKKTLESKYKLKTQVLGREAGEEKEIRILNKVVRMEEDGIELEADPRHAELVIRELGLEGAKVSTVPGAKDTTSRSGGMKKAKIDELRRTVDRRGGTADDLDIDDIQEAKESAGNVKWSERDHGDIGIDGDHDDPELGQEDARTYRGVAARLNYISPDRPDIAYAVKEAARDMSMPRESSLRKLRKIGRYLIGVPRLIARFRWQDMQDRITAFTDSDWAGCDKTAKSTSGGAICIGEHILKTYSKQQKVVALSSAEAELYAMVAASAETLAIQAYCRDLGMDLQCELYCDSSAALGISQRAGIGKVRHLRTQGLWVQEVRSSGRISYKKVLGTKNPADLMTKHMAAELTKQHLGTLNLTTAGGRAETAPTLNNVESFVQGWYFDHESQSAGGDGGDPRHDDDRRLRRRRHVRFDGRVRFRAIPSEGRGRPVPQREQLNRKSRTFEIDMIEAAAGGACQCGKLKSENVKWSDFEDDIVCVRCASRWESGATTSTANGRASTCRESSGTDDGEHVTIDNPLGDPGRMIDRPLNNLEQMESAKNRRVNFIGKHAAGKTSSDCSLRRVNGGDEEVGTFQDRRSHDVESLLAKSHGISQEVEERARPDSTNLPGAAFRTCSTCVGFGNSPGWNRFVLGNRGTLKLDRRSLHRHPRGGGVKPNEHVHKMKFSSRCDNDFSVVNNTCIDNYGCIPGGADFAMQRRRRRSVGMYHPFCIFERACMCGHVCMCTSHRNHFPSGLKSDTTF